jgi:hypothetical protein
MLERPHGYQVAESDVPRDPRYLALGHFINRG